MLYERDTILDNLRQNVLQVSFTKVNGENRIMRCTLRPDILPPGYAQVDITEETAFHKTNPDVIACWDVQNLGWRSFRIDSVIYVEDVNGNY
jgi:hypothetical protein